MQFSPASCLFILIALLQHPTAQGQEDIFSSEVIEIDVQISEAFWYDTLVARKQRYDKTPLLCEVTIAGTTYHNIEMRFKGNSSFFGTIKYGGDKIPMKFEAPKGQYFAGGYDELRLSNNYRDPTAIREILSYEIAGTYIPTPRVAMAAISVNGEFVGVYTMTEGMGDRVVEEYYCSSKGVLIKCDPDNEAPVQAGCPKGEYSNLQYLGDRGACYKRLYDVKSKKEVATIIELCKRLTERTDPESYLAVHEALWMHALNNVMVNLDSYLGIFTHNYFVYKDEHGIFHPLIWDLNLSFGGFSSLDQNTDSQSAELSPIAHDKYLQDRRPLIQTLTKDKRHMYTYFYMINTIVEDWFASGRYLERGKELQEQIASYYAREANPVYTLDDFETNLYTSVKRDNYKRSIPGIQSLMEARITYLESHPLLKRNIPIVTEWSQESFDGGVSVTCTSDSQLSQMYMYYKPDECSSWVRTEMIPLNSVTWQADVEVLHSFYFLLSQDKSATLSPRSAPAKVFMSN